jgi:hypothetical protein
MHVSMISKPQPESLKAVLRGVAKQYPQDLVEAQCRDVARIAFNIKIALIPSRPKPIHDLEICDLGGGIGLFSAGCAAYGLKKSVCIAAMGLRSILVMLSEKALVISKAILISSPHYWLGYASSKPAVRFATKLIDYPLRAYPALCSDTWLAASRLLSALSLHLHSLGLPRDPRQQQTV